MDQDHEPRNGRVRAECPRADVVLVRDLGSGQIKGDAGGVADTRQSMPVPWWGLGRRPGQQPRSVVRGAHVSDLRVDEVFRTPFSARTGLASWWQLTLPATSIHLLERDPAEPSGKQLVLKPSSRFS